MGRVPRAGSTATRRCNARAGDGVAAKQAPSALGPILAWIGVLWLVFGADVLLTHQLAPRTPPWEADYFASLFGIEPLVLKRLPCIFTAPFIHANPAHLI